MNRIPILFSALTLISLLAGCLAPPPSSPAAQILEQTSEQSQPIVQSPTISETSSAETGSAETGSTETGTVVDSGSSLSAEHQLILAGLPSRGVAPELFNETWLNSTPLKLADLRGKVVMIKFWTFG